MTAQRDIITAPDRPKMANLKPDQAPVTDEMVIFHAHHLGFEDFGLKKSAAHWHKYTAKLMLKIQAGYMVSYTENLLCMRLGLLGKTRGRLTKRGRRHLYFVYSNTDRF